MKILDEFETIHFLLKHKVSIARYGDGELKLCTGRSAKSQPWGVDIQMRLRQILLSYNPVCAVGIPRIYERKDWPTEKKGQFWNRYSGQKYLSLYDPNKRYYSAFVTRPDTNAEIDSKEYFDLIKQLWAGRDVLLYQGVGTRFDKTGTFFSTAKSLITEHGPAADAYLHYSFIFNFLLKMSKPDKLIVLALGPTATILAYDLAVAGRQTLDLGHLGQFYAHIHPKSTGTVYE